MTDPEGQRGLGLPRTRPCSERSRGPFPASYTFCSSPDESQPAQRREKRGQITGRLLQRHLLPLKPGSMLCVLIFCGAGLLMVYSSIRRCLLSPLVH